MKSPLMFLYAASLLGASLFATECRYEAKEVTVGWEAYKTLKKIGVKGVFDKIDLETQKESSVTKLLESLKGTIHTASVNSGNAGRDKTLTEEFFKLFVSETIQAKIVDVKGDETGGTMVAEMTMNGIAKKVPLQYRIENDKLKANGYIDMFDFGLSKALGSINAACYDLHSGKTWNDVAVSMEFELKKSCN